MDVLEIWVANDTVVMREFTEKEKAQRETDRLNDIERAESTLVELTRIETAKKSVYQKLRKLGLTEQEISALVS